MGILRRSFEMLLVVVTMAVTVAAQEPDAALTAGDAQEYLGGWSLTLDFGGQEIKMSVEFLDEDGLLVAMLRSPQGNQRITEILAEDQGLQLLFESNFGKMSIDARLENDELLGVFRIPTASLEADFRGVRGEVDVVLAGGGAGGLFGSPAPRTRLEIDEQAIVIRFPDPERASAQLMPVPGGGEGQELHFTGSSAVQLRTDLSLRFADSVIEAGNLATGYPGVYSLWLKRVGEEWSLVFNREGDIWGTQHDPAFDVAEVPLEFQLLDAPVENLKWKLKEADGGGRLLVSWDRFELSASFETVETGTLATDAERSD